MSEDDFYDSPFEFYASDFVGNTVHSKIWPLKGEKPRELPSPRDLAEEKVNLSLGNFQFHPKPLHGSATRKEELILRALKLEQSLSVVKDARHNEIVGLALGIVNHVPYVESEAWAVKRVYLNWPSQPEESALKRYDSVASMNIALTLTGAKEPMVFPDVGFVIPITEIPDALRCQIERADIRYEKAYDAIGAGPVREAYGNNLTRELSKTPERMIKRIFESIKGPKK